MNFKEVLEDDIKAIIDMEEFGEFHNINGKDLLIIIDENELTEREKKVKDYSGKGLHLRQFLFYIQAADFGPLPLPGRVITFDGKRYCITDAANEDGIYSVSLEATRS